MTDATNITTDRRTPAKVVVGSLTAGVVAAAALVTGPFAGGGEATITGAVLFGFAIGWALMAMLSTRRGDGSLHWAMVPATALGGTGGALIAFAPSPETLDGLGWVWPPALLGLVIWMAAQTRRQPKRTWPLNAVFGLMAIAAVGGGYETIQAGLSGGAAIAAGDRLVDVGDHRLNIRCIGSGSPTVVLEPGLGEPSSAMAKRIAPRVARSTRVCVYDRAGHGRSDVAPKADAARDLHVLLARAGVPRPYVLAGHSLGGPLVLNYAARYPGEVGGLALIDSMYPKQTHTAADMTSVLGVVPTVARTGIARLLFDPADGKPVDQARQLVRDMEQMPAQLEEAAQLETLGDLPLAVISAGEGSQPGWAEDQGRLATLSSRSTHRTISGSTHGSLILDAEDATASSRAIAEIVRQVRGDL